MIDVVVSLIKGLMTNVSLTFWAAIFPLCVGVSLTFLASKSSVVEKIFSWVSLPVECICPLFLMYLFFYTPGLVFGVPMRNPIIPAVLALSISFIFYMPARYNANFSFLKNILYNGLGLISAIFKWSFVSRAIAVNELTMNAERFVAAKGMIFPFILAFFVAMFVILILEAARKLIKYTMK